MEGHYVCGIIIKEPLYVIFKYLSIMIPKKECLCNNCASICPPQLNIGVMHMDVTRT